MAKVTPVLWTQKTNKHGLAPIYLRIEANDRRKYISLRTYIRESQWNRSSRSVRKSHPQHEEINNLISQRIADAQSEIIRLRTDKQEVTARALKETLLPDVTTPPADFFSFADRVLVGLEREGKLYTHRRYRSVLKKFRAFTGEPLPFGRLTTALLNDYKAHLVGHHGNRPSTVSSNFRAIRAILYRAIREGRFQQADNPFFQFKVGKPKGKREKLSPAQLSAIEELSLEQGSLIWHVRNYFLFSFYCAGVRFGDVAKLRWDNIVDDDGVMRLSYRMSKTGSEKSIKLMRPARDVIRHYELPGRRDQRGRLFPILDGYDLSTPRKVLNAISAQNALVNKYLKKIAKQAKVPISLSFHVSRHSFADIARQKGWDVYLISKALGHSSLKVTEQYLKGFDTEALDSEMDSLFDID